MELVHAETNAIDQISEPEDFYGSILDRELVQKLKVNTGNIADLTEMLRTVQEQINKRGAEVSSDVTSSSSGWMAMDVQLYRSLDFIFNKVLPVWEEVINVTSKSVLELVFLPSEGSRSLVEDLTKVKFLLNCPAPSNSKFFKDLVLDLYCALVKEFGVHYVLDKLLSKESSPGKEISYIWEMYMHTLGALPTAILNSQTSPESSLLRRVE